MSVNSNSPPSGVQQGVQQKDGGGPIFVMQSMSAGSHGSNQFHERYMSNESLENDRNSTTSSTESPNSSGTQPRKVRTCKMKNRKYRIFYRTKNRVVKSQITMIMIL